MLISLFLSLPFFLSNNRYMAPEVLQTIPRHASADIFSLGITMYEISLPLPPPPPPGLWGNSNQYSNMLLSQGSLLPSEGPLWHCMRTGKAESLPGRPPAICQVIRACMAPDPHERPTPRQILALPLVHASNLEPDSILMAAKSRLVPQPVQFQRSISMSGTDVLSLFTEESDGDYASQGEVSQTSREALARNRVCTPTNFMTGSTGHYFFNWPPPGPTPGAPSATAGMETSPQDP